MFHIKNFNSCLRKYAYEQLSTCNSLHFPASLRCVCLCVCPDLIFDPFVRLESSITYLELGEKGNSSARSHTDTRSEVADRCLGVLCVCLSVAQRIKRKVFVCMQHYWTGQCSGFMLVQCFWVKFEETRFYFLVWMACMLIKGQIIRKTWQGCMRTTWNVFLLSCFTLQRSISLTSEVTSRT